MSDYWAGFVCGCLVVWLIPRLDAWLLKISGREE